jgi:hypothetical protein
MDRYCEIAALSVVPIAALVRTIRYAPEMRLLYLASPPTLAAYLWIAVIGGLTGGRLLATALATAWLAADVCLTWWCIFRERPKLAAGLAYLAAPSGTTPGADVLVQQVRSALFVAACGSVASTLVYLAVVFRVNSGGHGTGVFAASCVWLLLHPYAILAVWCTFFAILSAVIVLVCLVFRVLPRLVRLLIKEFSKGGAKLQGW